MVKKEIIFLTTKEAIKAICDDFLFFSNQHALFANVYNFLSNKKAWPGEKILPPFDINYKGIWIQDISSLKKTFHTYHDFNKLLTKIFIEDPIKNDRLCELYTMVFEVKCYLGKHPERNILGIYVETEMEKFKCRQCGKCCLTLIDAYCTNADNKDLQRWNKENREDILNHIQTEELWFNPKTGEELDRCPWLRKLPKQDKYICKIYETRPIHCKSYPKNKKQALKNGCKGFSE